ncbi:hypothetical protein R1sor_004276 [Riccia sorocarpa]|uniref:Uncharacterized protein n=1 Tax=Riccia sorocarpa TaxID=122646 RepID=A0ABD3HA29_9MARC
MRAGGGDVRGGGACPHHHGQPTAPSTQVEVGEGSSAGKKKKRKKKTVNKESHEASRARTENNHYIRHAWFTWFAENVEHKETFRYNTPGTSMGIRRFVEHLCELGRQTYERRRQVIPALPPWDKPIKTTLELWAQQVPSDFKDEYEKWIKTKVEMWQRWFEAGKARPVRLGSFSYKMKGCEPISDNQLPLGKELGMEGVVSYVAKKCDAVGTNTAWVMMHKELASFAETHCAIVRPIACHNIEAEPILVYPYWNGRDIYQWKRLGTRHKRN